MFRLLLLTGQRRDEVAAAPWAEFDLPAATWRLPGARTKNGRANVVPLSPAALDIIAGLPRTSRCSSRHGSPASGMASNGRCPVSVAPRLAGRRHDRSDAEATGATLPPWRIARFAPVLRDRDGGDWRRAARRRDAAQSCQRREGRRCRYLQSARLPPRDEGGGRGLGAPCSRAGGGEAGQRRAAGAR